MQVRELASNGAYAVAHVTLPGGATGALPRSQGMATEGFYVLSGRLSVLRGNDWTEAAPGTLVSVSRGTIQGFRNNTGEPAVFLGFATPGGLEELLPDLFGLMNPT